MIRGFRILILSVCALALCCELSVSAQNRRRVTPVTASDPASQLRRAENETKRKTAPAIPPSVVERTDDSGRVYMIDTVTGSEYVDSASLALPKAIGRIYPRYYAVTMGVDIWDPFMRCLGQKYGIGSIWAEMSFHNWIKPVLEFGLGCASNTPEIGNFTYRSPVAPYFKIGVNYNFLYNSNPNYQFLIGLRYGISNFSYSIDDVTVQNPYWDETTKFNIPSQRVTAGYGEVMLGLRVALWRNLSAGWMLKYHFGLHQTAALYGKPWYIPGYGTTNGAFAISLSVMYTIPLSETKKEINTDD